MGWRGAGAQARACCCFEPDAAAAADYAFSADHAIERLELASEAPPVGAVRVFGASDVGEQFDIGALAEGAATAVLVDDALDS